MTAKLIDGRAIAARITERVAEEVVRLKNEARVIPGLAVVLIGDDPASRIYVRGKGRKAEDIGFHSVQHNLLAETSEPELLALIHRLNRDADIHGILVQLPLPKHIDKEKVIEAIRPEKDVDGFNPINVGRLASGIPTAIVPCTPAGCLILIRYAAGNDIGGKAAVVIGRSNIVGRPMGQLLVNADCTVTTAHSKTRDLPGTVRVADIVVAATGRPEMVRGDWIKPGAVVIDVGVNRIDAPEKGAGKTRLVGDVAFDEVARVAAAITPVPGGVGPMTIAMLMANTLSACCRLLGRPAPDVTS